MTTTIIAQRIASRLHLQPALLGGAFDLEDILAAVEAFDVSEDVEQRTRAEYELLQAYGMFDDDYDTYESAPGRKPFAFADGCAIIPVHGMLVNRFGYSWGFITGYNFIRQQANAALADSDVKRVIFDVNSPGGEVSGCSETAAAIKALGDSKETMAVVDSNACSAAYWIASAANKITLTPSGAVGSIGAMMMHVDKSQALENAGYKVTLLHSGAHKVDGTSHKPLPDDVKASLQARLDETRNEFAATVAANRGLTTQAMLDTEAEIYPANEALTKGLVDAVATAEAAAIGFMQRSTGAVALSAEDKEISPVDEEVTTQATTVDTTALTAQVQADTKSRISAILSHAEAAGRDELAKSLAFDTDLSIEAAAALLQKAPKAAAPAQPQVNHFAAAMEGTDNPNIGEDPEVNTEQQAMTSEQKVNRILGNQKRAHNIA
mgnify:CR=1 FL=1